MTSSDSVTPPTDSVKARSPVSRAFTPVPARICASARSTVVTPATPGDWMSRSAGSVTVTVHPVTFSKAAITVPSVPGGMSKRVSAGS